MGFDTTSFITSISEKFLTAGLSWQFNNLITRQDENIPFFPTRLDIAIEAGLRSSASESLGSEKILRVYIALAKGETWFLRLNR